MIDTHSHVLPGMDDGSHSVTESVAMLQKMAEQGVTTVAATPHFYASSTEPAVFFEKRQASYQRLMKSEALPPVEIRLGAEVLYYEGLQRQQELLDFRIQGTQLFLLEMPFAPWSDRAIRGILDLNTERSLTVVMAHIDRYLQWQPISVFEHLASHGVLMQVNAEPLLHWQTRRMVLKLFQLGLVQFVGSDCHDLTHRPPNVTSCVEVLEKKMGPGATAQLLGAQEDMFGSMSVVV